MPAWRPKALAGSALAGSARAGGALVGVLAAAAITAGCAARRPPAAPGPQAPTAQPSSPAGATATQASSGETLFAEPVASAPAQPARPRLRDLCKVQVQGAFLDATRARLEETFCGATLWFDGLLGGEPDIDNARAVSGRVELSGLYTEFDGMENSARLRLRYDLPNLERRVNLFLGRDDREEFIADRGEGIAIRSSIFGLEQEEQWLAGLGYSPPGRWASKLDFRVGGKLKTAPEVFAQGRYRRNYFMGENAVWRLRETAFWENREGFGFTSSADYDRVLRPDLVFRWGSVGTITESTEGISWREAFLLYHNLKRSHAIAGEIFARGSTDAEIRLREYGPRAIYRMPLGKPYLFGELVVGYTWPRRERDKPREGSGMLGIGIELLFGRDPF